MEATGAPVPPSSATPPGFAWGAVGLAWPREALYARADARVERMYSGRLVAGGGVSGGLVAETRALVERYGRDFEALTSIGYAEALRMVDGEWTLREAIERTQTQTHRLIRAQASWFRAGDERIDWRDGAKLDLVADAVVTAARAPVR